ncbi:ACP S-malonyltransferase [Streptomyces sp. NPDC002855]|uniref:ACP S-malonyltransferase n=1 Tax=Streptomyces sp. NPDC002855 TaxID=3154437 RepID=UPI00331DCDDD
MVTQQDFERGPERGSGQASENTGSSTAALFPGQGVQRQGLGTRWRGTPSWEVLATVSEASGYDVEELLLETGTELLGRTDLAQITVFSASLLSWLEFRRSRPDTPVAAFAGHSLGEYTALVAAGALTATDGARLVGERGRAMAAVARRAPGAMAAVMGATSEEVEALAERVRESGESVWVANLNSHHQTVIAGTAGAIRRGAELARDDGWRYTVLPVSAACHTPLMAPSAEALRPALAAARFAPVHRPVVSNVDARAHAEGGDWADRCVRQLVSPVRWLETLGTLADSMGCDQMIDFGPGRTLAALSRRALPHVSVASAPMPAPEPAPELAAK